MISNLRISVKLSIPIVLLMMVIIGLCYFSAEELWDEMMETRQEKAQSIVEMSYTVLQHYNDLEQAGRLTREQAQDEAREQLRKARYDGSEYVFGLTTSGEVIFHGGDPRQEGETHYDQKDGKGHFTTREMIARAQAGGGFTEYWTPRTKGGPSVRKISYSLAFSPWNWVVGTGLYVDDVEAAYDKILISFGSGIVIILLIVGAIVYVLDRSIIHPMGRLTTSIRAIADGDAHQDVLDTSRKDEIGQMAQATETLRTTVAEAFRLREMV